MPMNAAKSSPATRPAPFAGASGVPTSRSTGTLAASAHDHRHTGSGLTLPALTALFVRSDSVVTIMTLYPRPDWVGFRGVWCGVRAVVRSPG
ncbi:hypothetical protein ADL03_06675 [Nocardia sp. NRRL S-836]|nr:hypothetical protein ADL03_06675 [Nocardia sp. NRRL S-836]